MLNLFIFGKSAEMAFFFFFLLCRPPADLTMELLLEASILLQLCIAHIQPLTQPHRCFDALIRRLNHPDSPVNFVASCVGAGQLARSLGTSSKTTLKTPVWFLGMVGQTLLYHPV